jgi:hypothetical protein
MLLSQLEKFRTLKGLGLEVTLQEVKRTTTEANATIDQLREMATTLSELMLNIQISADTWGDNTNSKDLELRTNVQRLLVELGIDRCKLLSVFETFDRWMKTQIARKLIDAVKDSLKNRQGNESDADEVAKELNVLCSSDNKMVAPAGLFRALIEKYNLQDASVSKLLEELESYERDTTVC